MVSAFPRGVFQPLNCSFTRPGCGAHAVPLCFGCSTNQITTTTSIIMDSQEASQSPPQLLSQGTVVVHHDREPWGGHPFVAPQTKLSGFKAFNNGSPLVDKPLSEQVTHLLRVTHFCNLDVKPSKGELTSRCQYAIESFEELVGREKNLITEFDADSAVTNGLVLATRNLSRKERWHPAETLVNNFELILHNDCALKKSEIDTDWEGTQEVDATKYFIYYSGERDRANVDVRRTFAKNMMVVWDISKATSRLADNFVHQLMKVYKVNEKTCSFTLGPTKTFKGIFKKATRKHLGREKDTNWEDLNFVRKRVKVEDLFMNIKDIIRGTMVFDNYGDMKTFYDSIIQDAEKSMGDEQDSTRDETVQGVRLVKKHDGFAPQKKEEDEEATYRDMKLVFILDDQTKNDTHTDNNNLDAKQQARWRRAKESGIKFTGVPFELQLNTIHGVVVKSGKSTIPNKEFKFIVGDEGLFDPHLFIEHCKEQAKDKQDVVAKIENLQKMLGSLELLNGQIIGVKGNPFLEPHEKAHTVYKMPSGSKEKDRLEEAYQILYAIGYLVDGYDYAANIIFGKQ